MWQQYSPIIRDSLPLVITRKGAIEREVFDAMARSVVKGGSFLAFANQLNEARHEEYVEAHARYTHIAQARAAKCKQAHATLSTFNKNRPVPNTQPNDFDAFKVRC